MKTSQRMPAEGKAEGELLKSADGLRRQQRLDAMAAMEEGNLLAMMEELGRGPRWK